jgi:molybdopterin converting factor small subunit
MDVTVRLFGAEAEAAGRDAVVVSVVGRGRDGDGGGDGEVDCGAVRAALSIACPSLEPLLSHARFAVKSAYATDKTVIAEGDEVALIGLVSGG